MGRKQIVSLKSSRIMSELLFGIFDIAERIQKTRKSKPCCHFSKIFFTPYMYCFSPDIIASHFLHAYIVVQPLTNPSSGEVSCRKIHLTKYICCWPKNICRWATKCRWRRARMCPTSGRVCPTRRCSSAARSSKSSFWPNSSTRRTVTQKRQRNIYLWIIIEENTLKIFK